MTTKSTPNTPNNLFNTRSICKITLNKYTLITSEMKENSLADKLLKLGGELEILQICNNTTEDIIKRIEYCWEKEYEDQQTKKGLILIMNEKMLIKIRKELMQKQEVNTNELKTTQDICNILGVSKRGLKTIEQRQQLSQRLEKLGYRLVEKSKMGRNNYYKIEILTEKEIKQVEHIEGFNVKYSERNSIGVYKITLNNQIYIGSTTIGFRRRFTGHKRKDNNLPTKQMLDNGGVFEIVQICDGMDETSIRDIETQWIQKYMDDSNWNCVNTKSVADGATKPLKKKCIRVYEEDYDDIILLLNRNGYKIDV